MIDAGFRSYEWHDSELYLHTDRGFMKATLVEAADELPMQALACISAKRAWRAQLTDGDTIIIGVHSDDDAEWCEDTMRGYRVGTCIKWSPEATGGSMFFEKVNRG